MAEDREDPQVAAWRGLLIAHSRLVPAIEADLRAAGQVLSRTRVSRGVDELAAAGLAERQPDEADGRSSFAVLTPAGKAALRRAWPVYREAIRRRLGAQLTVQQSRELATLLEHAVAGAEAATLHEYHRIRGIGSGR